MMTPKERAVMQQALDALEELFHSNSTKVAVEKYNTAYNALREALDHSGEADEMVVGWDRVKPDAIASDPLYQQGFVDGVEEGRNQVAEQVEQEPVACIIHTEEGDYLDWNSKGYCFYTGETPLYVAPVSIAKQSETDSSSSSMRTTVRTKDLTDVDLWRLWEKSDSNIDFARAVISAYKEKNK